MDDNPRSRICKADGVPPRLMANHKVENDRGQAQSLRGQSYVTVRISAGQ